MLRMLQYAVLAIALLSGAAGSQAARIGVASVVKNSVSGSNGGKTRVINVGAGIFQNEIITTGAESSAQLLFRDETSLTIGSNARLILDRFVYDANRKTGDVVVNVIQGAFRFVSGSAVPGSYKIKTPAASIGLRGTVVEGFVNADGALLLVVVEGTVIATAADGTSYTLNAGQYITISRIGAVTGPSPWTGRALDIESGHEFILDTQNPQADQRNELNDALDSRGLDITFPPELPRSTGKGGSIGGSDIRLKRDIEYLATLESGIRVYSFRYLREDVFRVGVMAQDILRDPVHKQAVVLMPNGFYGVNYAMLGLKMTTLSEWKARGFAAVRPDEWLAPVKARMRAPLTVRD